MSKKSKSNFLSTGFSLIELLVVISIMAVLAGLLLPNFLGLRARANDSRKKNDLRQLKTALRLYYNDFQHYPLPAAGNSAIAGCGADANETCTTSFSAGTGPTIYIKDLPSDFEYFIDTAGIGDYFLMRISLENVSDEDIVKSQTRCVLAGHPYEYSGTPGPADYFVCSD